MINTDPRPHAALYPVREGVVAFFDLDTKGPQAGKAVGLSPGTVCIVARHAENERIRLDWFVFSREELLAPADDPSKTYRVFYGAKDKNRSEVISKSAAIESPLYRDFFSSTRVFKRASVIESE